MAERTRSERPIPRRALIMGATGRLGVAIAHALARRGGDVVLTARDATKLDILAENIETESGRRPAVIPKNLLDDDAPTFIAREVVKHGPLDDVVLACGPFPRTPIEALARDELEHTLRVHAIAPLLLVNELAGSLAKREGAVVALTDSGVQRPYQNHVAYLTAKGALQTGLRALAVELAPSVRLNMVSLGIVADPEADADPLRTHRIAARSPLGRFGTPEEVVHTVLALLDATWATGEIWGIGR
jgi:pteridine reductase